MSHQDTGTERFDAAEIANLRQLQGQGLSSAVGEYTPPEFWEALDTIERLRAALASRDEAAQTGEMGIPKSCGKPLCSVDEHHPLCRLHKQPEKPAAQQPQVQAHYRVKEIHVPRGFCVDGEKLQHGVVAFVENADSQGGAIRPNQCDITEPQGQAVSDEEIDDLWKQACFGSADTTQGIVRNFARAILALRDKPDHFPDAAKMMQRAPLIEYKCGDCGAAGDEKKSCWCQKCRPVTLEDMRMVLCPECGNKRCPKANDHRNACTNSNEPGQPGSAA